MHFSIRAFYRLRRRSLDGVGACTKRHKPLQIALPFGQGTGSNVKEPAGDSQSARLHGLAHDRERDVRAHRLPTLAALDLDGRVIVVGGIPSEIAPGAALGYLVVPPGLRDPVAAMVLAGGQAPGRVEQEALSTAPSCYCPRRRVSNHQTPGSGP